MRWRLGAWAADGEGERVRVFRRGEAEESLRRLAFECLCVGEELCSRRERGRRRVGCASFSLLRLGVTKTWSRIRTTDDWVGGGQRRCEAWDGEVRSEACAE